MTSRVGRKQSNENSQGIEPFEFWDIPELNDFQKPKSFGDIPVREKIPWLQVFLFMTG